MADEPPERRDDAAAEDSPGEGPDGRPEDPEGERPAPEAPLADLAERVRRRRAGEEAVRGGAPSPGDADPPADDPFVPTEAFDPAASDRLWQAIGASSTAAAAEPDEAAEEHVVPKRAYCESCEHLGEPPAVHCTHPGTTIVEFPDADHVRLRDCPVVAERRATGEAREAGRRPGPFDRGDAGPGAARRDDGRR